MSPYLGVAAIIIPMSFSVFVNAAEKNENTKYSPFYVNAGFGINDYLITSGNAEKKDNQINAWEVNVGFTIAEYYAVEIGYRDLGDKSLDFISGEGVTMTLLGTLPITANWSVFGEFGGIDQFLSTREPGVTSIFAGAGVGYKVGSNVIIQALYRRYEDLASNIVTLDDIDSNYFGLKIQYHFNVKHKTYVAPVPLKTRNKPKLARKPVTRIIPDSDRDGVNDNLDLCPNTPIVHKVDVDGCTEYEKTVSQMNIDAKFGFNSAEVNPKYLKDIASLAEFMIKNPRAIVEIQGHASLVGGDKYNMELSTRRAKAVAKVLSTRFRINPNRITAVGYGKTRPLIAHTTPEANEVNRRIEAEVTVIHDIPLKR